MKDVQALREKFILNEVESDYYQRTKMFREQAERNVEAFQDGQWEELVEAKEERLRESAIQDYIAQAEDEEGEAAE